MANRITIVGVDSQVSNLVTQFDFDVMNIPDGVAVHAVQTAEVLVTRGVDGSIYRATGRQFKPFGCMCVKFHATFADAKTFQNATELLMTSFLTLESDRHGTHNNLFCQGVNTIIQAGEGVGSGVLSGGQAYTVTRIDMVLA